MQAPPNTSVLEPLDIYLDDLLFFQKVSNINHFTGDSASCICDDNLENVLELAK